MSNAQITEATIPGWSGPFFPEALIQIQKRYANIIVRFNDMLFDDIADQLNHGRVLHHPKTSDVKSRFDGPWSHAVEFSRHKHMCRVLFPIATDSKRADGTFALRHVALYFKGEPPEWGEIEQIGHEIADDFNRSYRHLYRH